MKISVKRALKLRKELEAMLTKVEFPIQGRLSLLVPNNISSPMREIMKATASLADRLKEYEDLSAMLATIRIAIAKANVDRVETILATMAHIDRRVVMLKKIASAAPTPPEEELKANVDYHANQLRAVDGRSYGGSAGQTLTFSAISPQMVNDATEELIRLKRERADLEDTRAGANASTQIEIDDDRGELLRKLGMI
jgi:trans-aconitate methyltransferase